MIENVGDSSTENGSFVRASQLAKLKKVIKTIDESYGGVVRRVLRRKENVPV